MLNDTPDVVALLKRLVRNTDKILRAIENKQSGKKTKDSRSDRVAKAIVAIAEGASSFQEIADRLGVSRGTISKDEQIRRAFALHVRDRSVCKESADEFRFENSR